MIGVVIAVHAQARQVQAAQLQHPVGRQVAECDHRVRVVARHQFRGAHGRRLVGNHQESHHLTPAKLVRAARGEAHADRRGAASEHAGSARPAQAGAALARDANADHP